MQNITNLQPYFMLLTTTRFLKLCLFKIAENLREKKIYKNKHLFFTYRVMLIFKVSQR